MSLKRFFEVFNWKNMQRIAKTLEKNAQYVAGVATAGVYIATIYPQLWGLKQYREMLQMYQDGEPVAVDPDSQRIARKVLDSVLWDPISEANIELFTAYGQDIVHRGSTYSSYGAIIGIPLHFSYQSVDDIDKDKITLGGKKIKWDSPAGQQLADSLILSEKARQFAIARELFYLHTHHIHVYGLLLFGCGIAAYWTGAAINAMYRLTHRTPVSARAAVFGFIAGAWATVYCLASDSYSSYRDRKADRKVAALHFDYADGGVEFYNKLLQRNQALRSLMGRTEGRKKYTAYGNNVYFWRSPTVPLTSRRDKMVKLSAAIKGMQKKSDQPKSSIPPTEPA